MPVKGELLAPSLLASTQRGPSIPPAPLTGESAYLLGEPPPPRVKILAPPVLASSLRASSIPPAPLTGDLRIS